MRPSSLLRQAAAAAASAARVRLPRPNIIPPGKPLRLRPEGAEWLESPVNAPTTFPPVLLPATVDKHKLWGTAKHALNWLKNYLAFHRQGLLQLRSNRKIRKILKGQLMKQLQNVAVPGSANINLVRSEFQMMIRTRRDNMKAPLFLVILAIFGELTPIVMWFGGRVLIPGTNLTPLQLENRRRRRADDLDRKNLPVTPRVMPTIEQVNQVDRRTLIHECRILGVFPRWTPVWAFPTMYIREKLIRRVNYLEYDDELLRQYEEEYISIDEVKQILEERGVYIPPIPPEIIDLRSLFDFVSDDTDVTGMKERSPQELFKLLELWLKMNEGKHPNRPFSHEVYIREMVRWGGLPDL